MSLKIYADFMSQPSRAVLSLTKICKIPYQLVEIRINKGAHLTPEYIKVNPLKRIPAIDDNGFLLSESHAILTYLCQTRNVADHLYPKDLKKRALIDMYLHWHHANTRRCEYLFQTLTPEIHPECTTTTEIEEKNVHNCFKYIEDFYLSERKFISNQEELSIADISCASEIIGLKLAGFDYTPYPVIRDWLKKVFTNSGVKEAHKVFFKVVEKKKGPIVI